MENTRTVMKQTNETTLLNERKNHHYRKMMTVLEDPNNRGSEMKENDMEGNKTQVDQNQRRAVVTGFHDDTTEQKVQDILKETITAIGISTDQIQIR